MPPSCGTVTLSTSFTANYVDELTINSPGSPIRRLCRRAGRGRSTANLRLVEMEGHHVGELQDRAILRHGPGALVWQRPFSTTPGTPAIWRPRRRAGRSRTACSMSIRPPISICARSYDLTDNLQFYRRVDNLLDIPPQMVPGYSGGIQSNGGPTPLGHAVRPAGPRNPRSVSASTM